MGLGVTPSLKGALGELYFKESCDQQGLAHVALHDIDIKNNTLVFSKGINKINIRLMDKIVPEIKEYSRPFNGKFLFDYLASKVGQNNRNNDNPILVDPAGLNWVKMGKPVFSSDQLDVLGKMRLSLGVFRIRNILAAPPDIEMKWDIKSGEEWLNEIEDLRDQAESDDEYL